MRRTYHYSTFVCLSLMLAVAGCGGSSGVTGPDEASVAAGAGVIAGTVVGGGVATASSGDVHSLSGHEGLLVSVEGTPIQALVDEEGEFALAGVPAGSVELRFAGPGVDARVTVTGVLNAQVMSLQVHVSGATAQVTSPPECAPTQEVKFTGILESRSGHLLVVGGRHVDASQVRKIWRNGRRAALEHLEVGEKLKVWGTQRADGGVVAEEIEVRSSSSSTPPPGNGEKVSFKGKVESISFTASTVHASPNGHYPTLVVAGRKVKTDGSTRFKWSDSTHLDPREIKVGDRARVEGRKKNGHVLASKLVVDCR